MIDQPSLPGFEPPNPHLPLPPAALPAGTDWSKANPAIGPRVNPTVVEAEAARDAGIAQSARTAGAWSADADRYLRQYLEAHEFFHVDEFWTWAYSAGLDDGPSPRGFGAVVQRAARLGLMAKTRTHLNSARSHLAPKPVWRSNLYSGSRRGTLRGVPVH